MVTGNGVEEFEPGTAQWENARKLFDASLDRRPSRVFCPHSLRGAVELVQRLQLEGQPYTLKSGGHSAAGLSVANGVPLVELSRLRGVRIDPARSVVALEAGAQLIDLDRATTGVGMATTGGTVSHTGVVGLACGGGLGWLMGRFGLACDNILQATIVDSGNVRVIDESSPEMRILRGAGTSLGMIAELVMRIYPIEARFRWSVLRLSSDRIVEGFAYLQDCLVDIPGYVGCAFTIQSTPEGSVNGLIDIVAPANISGALDWTRRVAVIADSRDEEELSYLQVQQTLDPQFEFGRRSYRRSLCIDNVSSSWIDRLVDEFATPSIYSRTVTFDILHGQATDLINEASSSFARRRYVILLVCQWTDPRFDLDGRREGRRVFSLMADSHSEGNREVYGNYSSEPSESIGCG